MGNQPPCRDPSADFVRLDQIVFEGRRVQHNVRSKITHDTIPLHDPLTKSWSIIRDSRYRSGETNQVTPNSTTAPDKKHATHEQQQQPSPHPERSAGSCIMRPLLPRGRCGMPPSRKNGHKKTKQKKQHNTTPASLPQAKPSQAMQSQAKARRQEDKTGQHRKEIRHKTNRFLPPLCFVSHLPSPPSLTPISFENRLNTRRSRFHFPGHGGVVEPTSEGRTPVVKVGRSTTIETSRKTDRINDHCDCGGGRDASVDREGSVSVLPCPPQCFLLPFLPFLPAAAHPSPACHVHRSNRYQTYNIQHTTCGVAKQSRARGGGVEGRGGEGARCATCCKVASVESTALAPSIIGGVSRQCSKTKPASTVLSPRQNNGEPSPASPSAHKESTK